MLSEEVRQHFNDDWKGVKQGTKAVEVSRTKRLVRQTWKDLELVAKKLPEKHLAGVFTADEMMPFIKALLKERDSVDEDKRVRRLSQICRQVLDEFAARSDGIAKEATAVLAGMPSRDQLERLRALLIRPPDSARQIRKRRSQN